MIGPLKLRPPSGALLPISVGDTVPFTPAGASAIYHLRVPTHRIEARFEAALVRAGVYYPSDEAIRAELRRAIVGAVDETQQPEVLTIVDELAERRQAPEVDPEGLTAAAQAVASIEAQLSALWPPLAELHAQRAEAGNLSLWIRARHYLAGWEAVRAQWEIGPDGLVTEAALDRLPLGHVVAIGAQALAMRWPDPEQEANLKSPSPSPSIPTHSTSRRATPRRQKAGGSAASTTTPIPQGS